MDSFVICCESKNNKFHNLLCTQKQLSESMTGEKFQSSTI